MKSLRGELISNEEIGEIGMGIIRCTLEPATSARELRTDHSHLVHKHDKDKFNFIS